MSKLALFAVYYRIRDSTMYHAVFMTAKLGMLPSKNTLWPKEGKNL
jgi:hypothetical protein